MSEKNGFFIGLKISIISFSLSMVKFIIHKIEEPMFDPSFFILSINPITLKIVTFSIAQVSLSKRD